MELKAILSGASLTKEQVAAIVTWIGAGQQRFDELFGIFTTGSNRMVQRTAWPLSYCVIQHPSLIQSHYKTIIQLLTAPGQPAAVKRNILRLLDQGAVFPKKFHGQIIDFCFKTLEDPKEPIAARAFSMGILSRFTDTYPEIHPELKTVVELILPNASPGVKSRALKILKQ
ncbi:hypothetical protein [Niabella soli]|uniref:Uncharacterized protein n=1 Tax=Niabella soli DSM 19437 TaxID=929713 RepID=W0F7I6_9BACT|nr:hypothetical protein [Niabella soli]AHF17311.1 hypothetical protein NIASO_05575 [Niabella soli DSM 19437]